MPVPPICTALGGGFSLLPLSSHLAAVGRGQPSRSLCPVYPPPAHTYRESQQTRLMGQSLSLREPPLALAEHWWT